MKHLKPLLILTTLLILLTACAPTPTATPTEVPTQVPTATEEPTPEPINYPTNTAATAGTFLARPAEQNQLRLLNYNINWDAIFPEDDPLNHIFKDYTTVQEFERLLTAIQPDIICLEELNSSRPPETIAAFINNILPLEGGWYASAARDNFILSRFPVITDGYKIGGNYQAAALIDLPDAQFDATDFYMICSHFKAGGSDGDIYRRQEQADVLINHMRDAQSEGDRIDLPTNTPFMMMGDFNIYDTDPAYHIETLITGDIINEDNFGTDYPADWDQTALTDALPTHNGEGKETYTWRDDSSNFTAGALDRIVYSDSLITITNSFVLNTTTLSADQLALFGLEANDVVLDPANRNFDHLPMILDFIFITP